MTGIGRGGGRMMRRGLFGVAVAGAMALTVMGAAAGADAATKARKDKAPPGPSPIAWSTASGPSGGPAQAIGGYASGCLAGGVPLAGEGTGYQVIRLSRHRNYGHPVLVDYLRDFGRKVAGAGLGTALIADMAQPRGGPMRFGHASHQSGLDADVWLRLDLPPMGRNARESLDEIKYVDYDREQVTPQWSAKQSEMVRIAASDLRVNRIFVNPAIKAALCERNWPDRAWLNKVRPWHGHDGHMHVRLDCPPGSPQCEPQRELPPGDGCGEELESWLRKAVPAREIPPEKARPPSPRLPAACTAVLRAGTRMASADVLRIGDND